MPHLIAANVCEELCGAEDTALVLAADALSLPLHCVLGGQALASETLSI